MTLATTLRYHGRIELFVFLSQTKKVSHHTECITERQTRRIQSYRSPACLLSCPRYSISKTCCDQSHGSWAPPLGSRMQRGQPQSERCATDPDTSPGPDKIRDVRRSPSQSLEVCKHQKELRPRQHVNWNRFPADPLALGQFLKPQKSNTSRCPTFLATQPTFHPRSQARDRNPISSATAFTDA